MGYLPLYSKFPITGSFDNPAGFAAVLAMWFPICLFLFVKAGKVEIYLASAGLLVILIAIGNS
jgi:O-antigen polymerase